MRILQLTYYPIEQPITGGQRRVAKLRSLLLALGHDVTTRAIAPLRPDVGQDDIVLTGPLNDWVFRVPYDFEMRIAHAIQADKFLLKSVKRMLRTTPLDIIWLEHPFLWPLIKDYWTGPVCYSSHNVEWIAKRDCLKQMGIFDPYCVSELKRIEDELSWRSSFVVCCSDSDQAALSDLNSHIIVVPNGADKPTFADLGRGGSRLEEAGVFQNPTFTYVSSAHLPNLFGLVDLVIEPLGRHPPSNSIIVLLVGGICTLYQDWLTKNGPLAAFQVVCLPDATEDEKNLALLRCHAILLPITNGGGTNLKTAEALLSDRPIVATSMAFRGYENWLSAPGVFIADDSARFCQHVMSIADMESNRGWVRAPSDVEALSWDSILATARARVNGALSESQRL
jgi:hypothetical protein